MKNKSLLLLICITILIGTTWFAQTSFGMNSDKNKMTYESKPIPNYVKFFTNDDDKVIRATESGVYIYEIPSQKLIASALIDEQFVSLEVYPNEPSKALVSTFDGKVYRLNYDGQKLSYQIVEELSESPVGIIKDFLFKRNNNKIVVAADERSLFWSVDGGRTWKAEKFKELNIEENHRIITLTPIPRTNSEFLVCTSGMGRFKVNWLSHDMEYIADQTMPHGFTIRPGGLSYVAIGEGSDYLSIKDLRILPLDIMLFDDDTLSYYIAGLGTSPLLVHRQGNRYDLNYLNSLLTLTYSIDVRRHEKTEIILSSPTDCYYSNDGGQNWMNFSI